MQAPGHVHEGKQFDQFRFEKEPSHQKGWKEFDLKSEYPWPLSNPCLCAHEFLRRDDSSFRGSRNNKAVLPTANTRSVCWSLSRRSLGFPESPVNCITSDGVRTTLPRCWSRLRRHDSIAVCFLPYYRRYPDHSLRLVCYGRRAFPTVTLVWICGTCWSPR